MTPLRTAEWVVQFAAPWSAAWLLLIVPAALALGAYWYRGAWKSIPRAQAAALAAVRLAVLATCAVLLFRPSVTHRQTLRYPGRVVLLLDDSRSMTARDTELSAADALHAARKLGTEADQADRPAERFHAASERLLDACGELQRLQNDVRELDRRADAYWEAASTGQERITGALNEAREALERGAASLERGPQAAAQALAERLAHAPEALSAVLALDAAAADKSGAALLKDWAAWSDECRTLGAELDRVLLEAGDAEWATKVEAERARTRLDRLGRVLARLDGRWEKLAPGLNVEAVALSNGERVGLASVREALQPASGGSEVLARLRALADEEHDFPLAAVVLCSDGRDTSQADPLPLARSLAERQIPVFAAGLGAEGEPRDIAVLKLAAPPFAVTGAEARVSAVLKTACAKPEATEVTLERDGRPATAVHPELGRRVTEVLELRFAPEGPGLQRLRVKAASRPEEIFPVLNNQAETAIQARSDRVRVLVFDAKPRWETRFFIHTLRRLDYIELNPIVASTQPNGEVVRGSRRGAWPENAEAFAMYDLIVLGRPPEGFLTEEDWRALRSWVAERGKTLFFLAPDAPPPASVRGELWPLRADAAYEPPAQADRLDSLRLTPSGRHHPLTAALAPNVSEAPEAAREVARPDTQVLLASAADGAPVLACRGSGQGRTALLSSDTLWKALNESCLEAHGELVVNLVTWAVQNAPEKPPEAGKLAELACDRRVLREGQTLQVWVRGAGGTVEVRNAAGIVAEQTCEPPRPGASIARAVFDRLPADDLSVRLKDRPETECGPVLVLADDPELKWLARGDVFLKRLTAATGGAYAEASDLDRILPRIKAKERVERLEQTWRLWDSVWVLTVLVLVLGLEWTWRKWVGLV
ncbi:MAG: hypothetical protein AMXMBFR7_18970 [Planctomycetota bacterium]